MVFYAPPLVGGGGGWITFGLCLVQLPPSGRREVWRLAICDLLEVFHQEPEEFFVRAVFNPGGQVRLCQCGLHYCFP